MIPRKILHIDMDAFYASVEQRDRPALRGKPVIVGGDPRRRGVVAACSYEARRFGIRSAMPGRTAYRKCPHAVFLKPRFDVYKMVSGQIREIFFSYTDLVEPLSLDEAFLDVTENKKGIRYATQAARDIRREILEQTGLTASAGVSFNKFLAKIASDINKPDGMTVIPPEKADAFIDPLPIGRFFGVGRATEARMKEVGIHTGADLKRFSETDLVRLFGKTGHYYYMIAHNRDPRPVNPERIRKSLGKEITLDTDICDRKEMLKILEEIAEKVIALIRKNGILAVTLTLKVKYQNFQTVTRSITSREPFTDGYRIMDFVPSLLNETEAGPRKVRLLGLTLSNFIDPHKPGRHIQLPLPLLF